MSDWYRRGAVLPIPFKVTLNNVGVTGLTFDAADITYGLDGGTAANCSANGTIAETTFGKGWYTWTPSASVLSSADFVIINVIDSDSGGEFDENGLVKELGGDQAGGYWTGT